MLGNTCAKAIVCLQHKSLSKPVKITDHCCEISHIVSLVCRIQKHSLCQTGVGCCGVVLSVDRI